VTGRFAEIRESAAKPGRPTKRNAAMALPRPKTLSITEHVLSRSKKAGRFMPFVDL
jgi:hypothetical protein